MRSPKSYISRSCLCCAFVGFIGLTSFIWSAEEPEHALQAFAKLFLAQDAAKMLQIVHPDIRSGKEVSVSDVEQFLKRYHSAELTLRNIRIDKRFKSEDGTTERVQATFTFKGPSLGKAYPGPCTLKMVLLWVLDEKKWWLERPISIAFQVSSSTPFPTARQEDLALRFETALGVLNKIESEGRHPELSLIGRADKGPAVAEFKELEKLHPKERDAKGVHRTAYGVQVLLRAAAHRPGGFLQRYHGDFTSDPTDTRRPVPWDMFRDYVEAAIRYGKSMEKHGGAKKAERVYRRIIALGRQLLEESGGYQFHVWGLTFEKTGARELLRLLPSGASEQRQSAEDLVRLASRRIDLLQTALNCLDDLADYNSLQAAVRAAQSSNAGLFRPWGINTLSILSEKGAPASPEISGRAGAVVLVMNPHMQKEASKALDHVASHSSPEVRSFVEAQRRWVRTHRVYGAMQSFR